MAMEPARTTAPACRRGGRDPQRGRTTGRRDDLATDRPPAPHRDPVDRAGPGPDHRHPPPRRHHHRGDLPARRRRAHHRAGLRPLGRPRLHGHLGLAPLRRRPRRPPHPSRTHHPHHRTQSDGTTAPPGGTPASSSVSRSRASTRSSRRTPPPRERELHRAPRGDPMSAIPRRQQPDVTRVLLADGWHEVEPRTFRAGRPQLRVRRARAGRGRARRAHRDRSLHHRPAHVGARGRIRTDPDRERPQGNPRDLRRGRQSARRQRSGPVPRCASGTHRDTSSYSLVAMGRVAVQLASRDIASAEGVAGSGL